MPKVPPHSGCYTHFKNKAVIHLEPAPGHDSKDQILTNVVVTKNSKDLNTTESKSRLVLVSFIDILRHIERTSHSPGSPSQTGSARGSACSVEIKCGPDFLSDT